MTFNIFLNTSIKCVNNMIFFFDSLFLYLSIYSSTREQVEEITEYNIYGDYRAS